MHKKNKMGTVGIIITIILLFVIVFISNEKTENVSYFQNFSNKLIMPIQNGLVYLKNKTSSNGAFFEDIDKLKKENEMLKKQKSEIEQSLRELEIIKAENNTLKEYLNIKEKYTEYEVVPAYVINRDISNYSNIIVINVGKNNGIDVNMTVIADEGLVGHVVSVTDTTAKVQTIIDTASVVTSSMSTSKDSMLVRGTLESNRELKATYIPIDADIVEEDRVETSGIGGVYPKGIYIGKIKKVINTGNIIDRYAIIETAVNFANLETIAVIKK